MPLSPELLEQKDFSLHIDTTPESSESGEIEGTPMSKWKKLIYGDDYNSAATFLKSPISAPPLHGNQHHQPTSSTEKWKRLIYGDDYVDDLLVQDRTTPSKKRTSANRNSSNDNNNKWERMIYGDNYFDENIAAITNDWEDEDYGYSSKLERASQKFKDLVLRNRTTSIAVTAFFVLILFVMVGVHFGKSEPEPIDPFVTKSATAGSRLRPVQHHYIGIGNFPDDDLPNNGNRHLFGINK